MSSVPKSQREEHDFMASHKLREIRSAVTDLARNDFGYDKEKLEEQIKRFEEGMANIDPEKKLQIVAKWRDKNESFYSDFVEEETSITRDILRQAVKWYEMGNSIFPSGESKLMEYCDRRKFLNYAIGELFVLKQELQYIAETLPGNKNRFEYITNEIKTEVSLIKGVRRAANKFLKGNDAKRPQGRKNPHNKKQG